MSGLVWAKVVGFYCSVILRLEQVEQFEIVPVSTTVDNGPWEARLFKEAFDLSTGQRHHDE